MTFIVTMTNGQGEYDQVLIENCTDGNKAINQANDDYNRVGWHGVRVKPVIIN